MLRCPNTYGIYGTYTQCHMYCIYLKYWKRQAGAISVDSDQMMQNLASDQGLHCLSFIQQFLQAHQQVVKFICSNFVLFVLRFYGPVNPMGSCRACQFTRVILYFYWAGLVLLAVN